MHVDLLQISTIGVTTTPFPLTGSSISSSERPTGHITEAEALKQARFPQALQTKDLRFLEVWED